MEKAHVLQTIQVKRKVNQLLHTEMIRMPDDLSTGCFRAEPIETNQTGSNLPRLFFLVTPFRHAMMQKCV